MTWVQRQRSSDLGRVVAGSSGSPGPWSLNCRARRQGQHGRSSASNACWCTGSVEGAHEVVGWPTMGRSTRLRMTWSRNTPGCPQVGHSLIGSTGSASITVTSPFSVAPVIVVPSFAVRYMVSTMTFPLGCTVGPLFCTDGLDTFFLQSQGPQYLVPRPNPRRTKQGTRKPEEPF